MISVHAPLAFYCEEHDAIMIGESQRNTHRANYHSKQYQCRLCNKTCSTPSQLQKHVDARHTGDKVIYKCDKCQDTFIEPWRCNKHIKSCK